MKIWQKAMIIFGVGVAIGIGVKWTGERVMSQLPIEAAISPDATQSERLQSVLGAADFPVSDGVAVINIWATWCAPCVEELPSLERLSKTADVPVLAISIDSDAKAAEAFLRDAAPSLRFAHDPSMSVLRATALKGVPVTLVQDAHGRIRMMVPGATQWDDQQVVAYVKNLQAESGS